VCQCLKLEHSIPCAAAIPLYAKCSPGSRLLIAAIASSIGAILMGILYVEGEGKILL
jgi:hypothetical protein